MTEKARALRQNATNAEKLLWKKLRDRGLGGLKFKRQYPVPPYILDFFCEEHALAVELDGGQHNEPDHKAQDKIRTDFLSERGIRVLRFWNNEVMENIEGVLERILENVFPAAPHPPTLRAGPSLSRGRGNKKGPRRILIGEITTVHGIKGLVKVRSYVEDHGLFETESLYTDENSDRTISLKLKSALKGDWLAEVKDVIDRNAAEKLRDTRLYINRESLPETDDGEFYVEDMIGMKVKNSAGHDIGVVIGVDNFGASDLLDIKPIGGGASFYLPFTDDAVLNVDVDTDSIMVELPENI